METFWFFQLWFRLSYHSAYDSDSDFVASENQPLIGLFLTLRDVPTFSAVVVIKNLVWLLSHDNDLHISYVKIAPSNDS